MSVYKYSSGTILARYCGLKTELIIFLVTLATITVQYKVFTDTYTLRAQTIASNSGDIYISNKKQILFKV